eukprot:3406018-Heterocapsa_arctica.AAC.1
MAGQNDAKPEQIPHPQGPPAPGAPQGVARCGFGLCFRIVLAGHVLEIICRGMAPFHLKSLDPKFGTRPYAYTI